MTLLTWSPDYAFDIRAIDDDHRGLFEVVETLDRQHREGQGTEVLGATINALALYVRDHFSREERLMASAHFPNLEAHLGEHRRFARLVAGLQALHADAPERVDIDKVVGFLSEWLSRHILGSDRRYVPHMKGETDRQPEGRSDGLETVTFELPPARAAALRSFADILDSGGDIADALESAIADARRANARRLREDAENLFCSS